jgi:hypothetical protein
VTVVVPMPTDRPTPAGDVHRGGISSARRELRAGVARRRRAEVRADARAEARREAGADDRTDDRTAELPDLPADLEVQRAGVRAALAELRQHRSPA